MHEPLEAAGEDSRRFQADLHAQAVQNAADTVASVRMKAAVPISAPPCFERFMGRAHRSGDRASLHGSLAGLTRANLFSFRDDQRRAADGALLGVPRKRATEHAGCTLRGSP